VIHGWSDALAMPFLFVERALHNSENKDISEGATCKNTWCLPWISAQKLVSHWNPTWLLHS